LDASNTSGGRVHSAHQRAVFFMVLLPVIWGTTFSVVKIGLEGSTPMLFNVLRFGMTAIFYFLFFPQARRGLQVLFRPKCALERQVALDALILGATLGGGYAFQGIGLLTTTASKSAFLTSTAVIWTVIFAYLINRHISDRRTLIGVLLAIGGTLLLTHPYRGELGFVFGDLMSISCAFCFGIYIVWVDKALPRVVQLVKSNADGAILVTFTQILVATILMAAVMPFTESPHLTFDSRTLLPLFYTTIFATAWTAYLQIRYQNAISPSRAALIYMLEPVVAAMIGYFFLTDRMGTEELCGALLIVGGVVFAQIKAQSAA
jgi:drug/metabolite transporter (DMT)-like permease